MIRVQDTPVVVVKVGKTGLTCFPTALVSLGLAASLWVAPTLKGRLRVSAPLR